MLKSLTMAIVMGAMLVLGMRLASAEEAAGAPNPWPAPQSADKIMGDYDGTFTPAGGAAGKAHGRLIAEGNGNYRIVLYTVAYPETEEKARIELTGQFKDNQMVFNGNFNGIDWTGTVKDGQLTAESKSGKFDLKHLVRKSPNEGLQPPKGAVVLLAYDGQTSPSLAAWDNPKWKILPDGSVEVTHDQLVSKQKFGDCQIHLEFCLPYMPTKFGQERANSGVYVQSRYEVQVLDSFGLISRDDDCGGIYHSGPPKVNASFPPLSWQTYDIIYRTARFNADCDTVEIPVMTVYHNGIMIHKGEVVPSPTPGGAAGNTKMGALLLQDHLNPVHYRNIWVLERNDIPYAGNTELAKLITQ